MVAYNLKTEKRLNYDLNDKSALSLDINQAGNEIYVLSELTENCTDTEEDIKQITILKIEEEALTEIDHISVFPKAKMLTTLSQSNFLLLEGTIQITEGDQYFNLLCINETSLAKDIVDGLYMSNKSEIEAPIVRGNEQNSTQGNTDGNSPIPEEITPQNSEEHKTTKVRVLSSVDHFMDQRVGSADSGGDQLKAFITIDEKRLTEIIDDRLRKFKDELRREIMADMKELFASDDIGLIRDRGTKIREKSAEHGEKKGRKAKATYAIRVSDETDERDY